MLKSIASRVRQGHHTHGFPKQEPVLPERFRGTPRIDATRCPSDCHICADACPTDALTIQPGSVRMDLGRCLFCTQCSDACPEGAVEFGRDYRLAARNRADLVTDGSPLALARALDGKLQRMFGRALRLRQVSAGGCNGCESDLNVLNTIVFDLGRFGVQIVASPRHADGLIITGPVTQNMQEALRMAYDAIPDPKLVIAVGACAISGGPFSGHAQAHDGAASTVPVDLYVPGCPPHPFTILDGILRLLGQRETAR